MKAHAEPTVAPKTSGQPKTDKSSGLWSVLGNAGYWSWLGNASLTVFALVSILVAIVELDQLVLALNHLILQVLFTAFCLFIGVVIFLELWERVLRRARGEDEPLSLIERIAETVWMVGVPTVGFAVLTALLVRHAWLLSATGSSNPGLAYVSSETYLWSLVDAIPFLNLTTAFDWHLQFRLLHESGRLFVLAYKLAIIVPLAYWLKTFTFEREPTDQGADGGG